MAADSSRTTPTKMKHQVAITLVRSSGAVICQSARSRVRQDTAGVFEFGVHGAEGRLQLLIGGGHCERDEGDEQDPERAVEHEGRLGIAEEQADAEHDAGNGKRRGGKEAERAMADDRLTRGDVADDDRENRAERGGEEAEHQRVLDREFGRRQFEEREVHVLQREIVDAHDVRGEFGEAGIEQREIRQEHRAHQHQHAQAERQPFVTAERTMRGSLVFPPTTA